MQQGTVQQCVKVEAHLYMIERSVRCATGHQALGVPESSARLSISISLYLGGPRSFLDIVIRQPRVDWKTTSWPCFCQRGRPSVSLGSANAPWQADAARRAPTQTDRP